MIRFTAQSYLLLCQRRSEQTALQLRALCRAGGGSAVKQTKCTVRKYACTIQLGNATQNNVILHHKPLCKLKASVISGFSHFRNLLLNHFYLRHYYFLLKLHTQILSHEGANSTTKLTFEFSYLYSCTCFHGIVLHSAGLLLQCQLSARTPSACPPATLKLSPLADYQVSK